MPFLKVRIAQLRSYYTMHVDVMHIHGIQKAWNVCMAEKIYIGSSGVACTTKVMLHAITLPLHDMIVLSCMVLAAVTQCLCLPSSPWEWCSPHAGTCMDSTLDLSSK
jgi:hypothetical protein